MNELKATGAEIVNQLPLIAIKLRHLHRILPKKYLKKSILNSRCNSSKIPVIFVPKPSNISLKNLY